MKYSPEIEDILSQKMPAYYKVGILFVGILLIILTPCVFLLLKEQDSFTASDIQFYPDCSKDSLIFFSFDDILDFKDISHKRYSSICILFSQKNKSGKGNVSVFIEEDGRIFLCKKTNLEDFVIRCVFTYRGKIEDVFNKSHPFRLRYDNSTLFLFASNVRKISDSESIVNAYLDINSSIRSRFVSIPFYIPSAKITNTN